MRMHIISLLYFLCRCGVDKNLPYYPILNFFYTIFLAWVMLLLSCMSYIAIAIKLFKVRAKVRSHKADMERAPTHVVIRFIFYISLMVFQWTPGSIFIIYSFFKTPPLGLTFVVVSITNIGGWLNALCFFTSRMVRENKVDTRTSSLSKP